MSTRRVLCSGTKRLRWRGAKRDRSRGRIERELFDVPLRPNQPYFGPIEAERGRSVETERSTSSKCKKWLEARGGIEPTYKGFADLALTTGVPRLVAGWKKPRGRGTLPLNLERETGVEPATSTLARSRSTTELLPLGESDYKQRDNLAAMTRLHGMVSMNSA